MMVAARLVKEIKWRSGFSLEERMIVILFYWNSRVGPDSLEACLEHVSANHYFLHQFDQVGAKSCGR